MSRLATRAGNAGDIWLAARLWAVACNLRASLEGGGGTALEVRHALDALETILEHNISTASGGAQTAEWLDDVHELLLEQLGRLMVVADGPATAARIPLIELVLSTDAAARDPINAVKMKYSVIIPAMFIGDERTMAEGFCEITKVLARAARTNPDPGMRHRCALVCAGWTCFLDLFLLAEPSLDWEELYGKDGCALLDLVNAYDYDTDHNYLLQTINVRCPHLAAPAVLLLSALTGITRLHDHTTGGCRDLPSMGPTTHTLW